MDAKTIGKLIRQRRKAKKITQAELAVTTEVSPRTLREIEKGNANPELTTLTRLCSRLGLEVKVEQSDY